MNADTETERRPERAGLGPGRAAPLARRRAQGAAPLPEGSRGARRLRRRRGRSGGAARGARADPPGRRRARAGRPAGRRHGAARQRGGGAALRRQAAQADAASSSTTSSAPRSRCSTTWRACSPASRCRRWRCSRSTARCRSWPAPTACIRPTCGRSTGAGASCRDATPTSRRASADADRSRRARSADAALMRGTPALAAAAQHERPVRRPRRRRDAAAGRAPVEPRRRRCSRRRPRACCGSTSSASASRRACWRSCASLERGDADVSERLAQDLLFFCAQAASPGDGRKAPRLAAGAPGLRPRATTRRSTTTVSVARPLRPGVDRAGAQARRRRQGSVVGGGRRRDAPPGRPGRAVRAGRRFAAAAVPARRDARRRAAAGGRADAGSAARRRRRRWRWKSRPACCTSRPRSRTATSTIPSRPSACSAWPSASPRCAQGAAARAARSLDGGAVPPRLRPPDDGQRGAGAARLAVRGREADRPVLPQPGRARRADPGAGPALGDARRAVGARHGPGVAGACCACATTSTAWSRPRSTRSASRRPACSTAWPATCGALGFLIDMLSVQPQMAKSLFVFDAERRHAERR